MNRFILLATIFLLPLIVQADERILDYRSDIQVHEDGWLTVTETIRMRAEGKKIRRGIYRDFPTRYKDRLGNNVRVEFVPLSVLRNGRSEPWHTKELGNGVRIYAGSGDRTLDHGAPNEPHARRSETENFRWSVCTASRRD